MIKDIGIQGLKAMAIISTDSSKDIVYTPIFTGNKETM